MNKKIMVLIATVMGVLAVPGFAAAQTIPADPTDGAITENNTRIFTWVMTVGVPGLLLAIGFGLLVRIGFKWVRRAGKTAGA